MSAHPQIMPHVIETSRLTLRRPRPEDAESIFTAYAQDEEVCRYLIWSPHKSIADTNEFLERALSAWETKRAFPYVITRREDQRLIGTIDLRLNDYKADVGYVLAREFWNRGFMTEALRGVMNAAFALEGVYRVWALCDVDNTSSARVMEKAGMVYEGTLRRYSLHPNVNPHEPRDVRVYAKIR
jgi:[ribosomal protein S5]-alanine N-acetyltransferase